MIAAEQGHAKVVEILLKAGADPSRRDRDGKQAVDLASGEETRRALAGP
jgi:ankyrin repeat protein